MVGTGIDLVASRAPPGFAEIASVATEAELAEAIRWSGTLQARGVPFALASGYGDRMLLAGLQNQPRLLKPFTARDLAARVWSLCDARGGSRRAEASLP